MATPTGYPFRCVTFSGPGHEMIFNFFALRLAGGSGGGLPVFNACLIAISANLGGHRPSASANSISVAMRHSRRRYCASGSDSI